MARKKMQLYGTVNCNKNTVFRLLYLPDPREQKKGTGQSLLLYPLCMNKEYKDYILQYVYLTYEFTYLHISVVLS